MKKPFNKKRTIFLGVICGILLTLTTYLIGMGVSYFISHINNDNSIIDLDGIVWRNESIHFEATSEELQDQFHGKNNLSKFELNGVTYYCAVDIGVNSRHYFSIIPMSEDGGKIIYVTESYSNEFIDGTHGDFITEKDKPYKYSLLITLNDECQYYDYCMANGLEFPETITLYGYEDK